MEKSDPDASPDADSDEDVVTPAAALFRTKEPEIPTSHLLRPKQDAANFRVAVAQVREGAPLACAGSHPDRVFLRESKNYYDGCLFLLHSVSKCDNRCVVVFQKIIWVGPRMRAPSYRTPVQKGEVHGRGPGAARAGERRRAAAARGTARRAREGPGPRQARGDAGALGAVASGCCCVF